MSAETVDKLIFALDGDLSALKTKYAEAEAGAQKTGTAIKANLGKGFEDAANSATKNSAAIKKALDDGTASATKQAAAMDSLRAKYDPAFAAAQKFSTAQKEINTLIASGAISADAGATAIKNLTAEVTHGHGATATATREFRALFDELSSGRTRQTPGTLAIIATRVFGIGPAALGAAVAITAIPVALALAAAQAEASFARIDAAIKRTGNAAGVTQSGIVQYARDLSTNSALSTKGAIDALSILISRGNIDGNMAGSIAKAVPGYARATGQSQDKASGDLEKLFSDPAKGAQQLNEEFKLLDVPTTRQIEDLQASGETTQAQAVLAQALNDRFDGLAKSSWSLSAGFDAFAKKLSNLWFNTGAALSGGTPADRLASLQEQRTDALKFQAPGVGRDEKVAGLDAQINKLTADMADSRMKAALDNRHAQMNAGVAAAMKVADSYDDQATKARNLGNQLKLLSDNLSNAIGPNAQFRAEIIKERDAVATALKNQRTPAQIASEEADDARRVARAPAAQQNTLREQLAAQRERERNLSDPKTAPFAESIYKSRMSVADLNKPDAALLKRQDRNLTDVQTQAAGQIKLADAYQKGGAAVAAMKAQEEAEDAVAKQTINSKQQQAYATALLTKEFASAAVAERQRLQQQAQSISGLGRISAAGGLPSAIAGAENTNKAISDTRAERDAAQAQLDLAKTDDQRKAALEALTRAQADYTTALAQNTAEAQKNQQIAFNKQVFGTQQKIGNQQTQMRALAGGASPDDMRHLEVAQQTYDSIDPAIDRTSDQFKKMLAVLLPLNEQTSDLADKLNKVAQEAQGMADGITGPLQQFLTHGGDIGQVAAQMGQNLLDTMVKANITDPLNKGLTGMFSSMLGGTGTAILGATPATPMYVSPVGGLGGLGDGSMGGNGGLLGNLFGNSNAGAGGGAGSIMDDGSVIGGGSKSGGLFSFLDSGTGPNQSGGLFGTDGFFDKIGNGLSDAWSSFAGLFDDGGTIGPGQWGVKTGMPEIIQGGQHGVSVLPLTAPVVKAAMTASGRGGGADSNAGAGQSGTDRSGANATTHNWFITTPNVQSFLHATSQVEAKFTQAAVRGQRNG